MTEPTTPSFPTAFLVIKEEDGGWSVTTDLTVAFTIDTLASRQDIRIGCQEIVNVINQQDQAAIVLAMLEQNSQTDSQQVSAKMRDAISRRKSE